MNALEIFLQAAVIVDANERVKFVDEACAGRSDVRTEVEQMLAAHSPNLPTLAAATGAYEREPEGTIDHTPVVEVDAKPITGDSRDAVKGTVIDGKYTLVEPIGEGGMGSVWRARQTEPVKRFVAVKLIKAGMDSKQVLARFEAERQALALMDHINIAKVYDGGVHDHRPYFVMEMVQGVPITTYCDKARLTPRQRMELIVPVCAAIQHAHQKGIIHRDIKPSNVLVAVMDDKPVVKVIDFGVAKATGGTLSEHTIDTGIGVVGTPEYMSPEQATFNNLDIDTRTDVYALGVLLYELLTGSPPFSRKDLARKGVMEMLRVVREDDPPRPSTKLSTADALPSLSAVRNIEPKKLTGLLRNELDWIVMKAIEKDRTRRYETPNGFAADIQRYLAGEPVIAHPPSTAYRIRKYVRRHRGQVAAATAIAAALVMGLATTTWQWLRAERNAKQVRKQLDQIENNQNALSGIFTDLDIRKVSNDVLPLEAVLAKRLVAVGEKLNADTVGDPLVTADLQDKLGIALLNLGFPKDAQPLFDAAIRTRGRILGTSARETLITADNLAYTHWQLDDVEKARSLWEHAAETFEMNVGPNDVATLQCRNNLATIYNTLGRNPEALAILQDVYARRKATLGEKHIDTLVSQLNVASAKLDAGQTDEAIALFEAARVLFEKHVGDNHPDTLSCLTNLADAYLRTGRVPQAVAANTVAYEKRKARLGPTHRDTLTSAYNLGLSQYAAGEPAKALASFEHAVRGMNTWGQQAGKPHQLRLAAGAYLGLLLVINEQPAEALPYLTDAYEASRTTPDLDWVAETRISAAIKAGKTTEVLPWIRERVADLRKRMPNDVDALIAPAEYFLKLKQFVDAENLARALIALDTKNAETWRRYRLQVLLGRSLLGQKEYFDSELALRQGYDGLKKLAATIPADEGGVIATTLDALIELYAATDKPQEKTKFEALRKAVEPKK